MEWEWPVWVVWPVTRVCVCQRVMLASGRASTAATVCRVACCCVTASKTASTAPTSHTRTHDVQVHAHSVASLAFSCQPVALSIYYRFLMRLVSSTNTWIWRKTRCWHAGTKYSARISMTYTALIELINACQSPAWDRPAFRTYIGYRSNVPWAIAKQMSNTSLENFSVDRRFWDNWCFLFLELLTNIIAETC